MKKRIWELDALRGLCILGMVVVHFVYDLTALYKIVDWRPPEWFYFIQNYGNILFFLISGTCATLGSHCLKRGLLVIGGGLICTAVTAGMYLFGFDKSILIYFGVLHCLGVCMLLWALLRKLPTWAWAILSAAAIAAGFYLDGIKIEGFLWLMPVSSAFLTLSTSDYFPLLPYLGYFLAGAVLGKLLYSKKQSLFPKANPKNPLIAVPLFFGKHSLLIYLLHQPLLSGLCILLGG